MRTQENRNIPFMTAATAIALLAALVASPSFARPGAGGGVGASASVGAGMTNQSSSHISTQGMANTNGLNASDRDTGTLRADDRASANGLKHGRRLAKGHTKTDTDGDSR